ncbi:MAG: cobalamin-dependent protein, partial [Burkholderiales bacterium]
MPRIVLATLNARYIHASLGLRYLLANMGELERDTEIAEFIITQRPIEIAEALLAHDPAIVGFGVYIWNVEETAKVIGLLKAVRPELVIVIGGPEVSYEVDAQAITKLADYVITGPGDLSFATLCAEILRGASPADHLITGETPALDALALPYSRYTEIDLAQRLVYVEASRGCPFQCEFCLSSLDKTALPFPLDAFLAEMGKLYARGARHFKFVDRTFNLNVKTSLAILDFFLARMVEGLFVHFEVIPDHLPDRLKEAILKFPSGSLQFEVGIQTLAPAVQALISRKQDDAKMEANLRWLRHESPAHIHADLIVGLPGEDIASFGRGFDRL